MDGILSFLMFGMRSGRTCPARSIAPATQFLFSKAFSRPLVLPPTSVWSSSTTPNSVGPVNGSLPIASRIRWQRYQEVLYWTPSVRFN